MLRSPIKLGILLGGLAAASLPGLPAGAQNPTTATPATNVPPADARARMWAATARFVYGDDPALASLRPQLRQLIDSSSVKAFGRSLDKAVLLEKKAIPKQGHTLKFQGDFKTVSARNEAPALLATSIANTLIANNPGRPNKATFLQLRTTLHELADPNAPAGAAAVQPASPSDTGATATAATPGAAATPAASNFITTPSPSSPMLTYLPLVLSILSLLVALVALLKGGSSKRRPHQHSSSAPSLTSLTDEMRAEVRTIVQREVSNKVPGARPAPDAPTKPQPAAKSAPAASVKATLAKSAPPKAPAPTQELPPLAELVASPAPGAPAVPQAAEAEDFFTVNYPVEEVPTPPAAAPTRTLYANQQPIDGIFQRNMLAEAPASYTIFELTTTADAPDQARFVVTGNPAGHAGYIGSHQNILGGACEYPFPKGNVSRIVTDAPGVAQRTASGDWQISKKAQIHFE